MMMRGIYKIVLRGMLFSVFILSGCSEDVENLTSPVDALDAEMLSSEASAGTSGEGFYASRLVVASSDIAIGEYTFRIYGAQDFDAFALLEDIDGSENSETIQAKIDNKRLQLYPDAEIAVEVSGGTETGEMIRQRSGEGTVPKAATRARLVKQIYWWNNVNPRNYYWFARYKSSVAVCFVNVMKGKYAIYRANGYSWKVVRALTAPNRGAITTYGSYALRGFKGIGRYYSNKADVVMYFFS